MIRLIKFLLKYRKHVKAWSKINYDYGIELGYPKCCVREFCQYPPVFVRWHGIKGIPILHGKLKFDAGCVDGKYTGFIPCTKHAHQVRDGKIKLESLISNRWFLFQPFPYEGGFEKLNEMIQNGKH